MKNKVHYYVGFGFVLFIFAIHMLPVSDSMLNENNTKLSQVFLKSQIRYHQEFTPFARRPLTSLLIEGASSVFGITLGEAFVLINFMLLFICGLLVYKTSFKLHGSPGNALLNLVFFFMTFSIVFSFFPPIFTYDEPLQYCLLLLSILAFINNKWGYYVLFFSLAIIARESSVFLIPGIVIIGLGSGLVSVKHWSLKEIRKWVLLFLPIPIYTVYLLLFLWNTGLWQETSDIAASRFQCVQDNFGTMASAKETLFSFILVLGPVFYLLLMAQRTMRFKGLQKRYIKAFILAVIVNTPIVMLATLAREARLYALPLIFLWPLVGQLFGKELMLMCKAQLYLDCFRSLRNKLYLLGSVTLNYWISFKVYVPSFPSKDNFFNEYFFIMLLLISIHFILHNYHRNQLKRNSN
ncbi:hypothetical protein KCTC52924_01854 [Arenibacter antarcticus]|uniref:DUF2029 domain-containing protein n=1 Tax=Arenibacter antarcticus TaxID=2040469 RepID=A0ABW5VHP2_9FLAO|nr:hypothetical protein [Arenibacter sp. H213]MCM4166998.1 hypothetical protein [Arenibacter sp. H213]